jgi:uncharacterized membrane protein YqaE (UPF0057 family)
MKKIFTLLFAASLFTLSGTAAIAKSGSSSRSSDNRSHMGRKEVAVRTAPKLASEATKFTSKTEVQKTAKPASWKEMDKTAKKNWKKDFKSKMNAAPNGDDQVIAVILAIFLCPFGILYWEGATTYFWIDLILWILGWGLGFGILYYLGLLSLAALILALLVVLDVI